MTHRPSWLFAGHGREEALHPRLDRQPPEVRAGDPARQRHRGAAGAGRRHPPLQPLRVGRRRPAAHHGGRRRNVPPPDQPPAQRVRAGRRPGGTTTFRQERIYPDAARSRSGCGGARCWRRSRTRASWCSSGPSTWCSRSPCASRCPTPATLGLNVALQESDPGLITQAIFNNPISFVLAVALLFIFIVFADANARATRVLVGTLHWLCQLVLLVRR